VSARSETTVNDSSRARGDRRGRIRPLAALAAVALTTALAQVPTTPARAATPVTAVVGAFQANTGVLWTVVNGVGAPTGPAMRTSSSPSVRPVYNGVEMAFQANTGVLWTVSNGAARSTGLAMKHGTSPRGTAAIGDAIVFHGHDGTLWIYRNGAGHSTGLRMKPASSPDMMLDSAGGFWIAFQTDAGTLSIVDPGGSVRSTGLRMRAGTSPALTDNAFDERHFVAFQADTGELWIVDENGQGASTGLRMLAGTNPSIYRNSFNLFHLRGFEVAFQTEAGDLWSGWIGWLSWIGQPPVVPIRANPSGIRMRAGTSPSLTTRSDGAYTVAFQADTGQLWIVDAHGAGASTGLGMMAGTSPSITGPLLI
jgi:hypothetical protein